MKFKKVDLGSLKELEEELKESEEELAYYKDTSYGLSKEEREDRAELKREYRSLKERILHLKKGELLYVCDCGELVWDKDGKGLKAHESWHKSRPKVVV